MVHRERSAHMPFDGYRARCSCGWASDCYFLGNDAERAVEVHLRKAQRESFDALIAQSSIGVAIADVKKRGIDAHLVDLEREMWRRRPSTKRARPAGPGRKKKP